MATKAKTPGMVIFVAIILIIVGVWSLLAGLCGGGSVAILMAAPEVPGKAAPGDAGLALQQFVAREVPGYYAVLLTFVGLDMLFGLGQLVAAIGLFRLSSIARILAIVLTLGKLLISFGAHAYQVIWVLPAQERFFQQNPIVPGGQPQQFDLGAFTQSFTWVFLGLTVVIELAIAFTVVLVLLMNRAAFAGVKDADDPPDENERRPRYEGYDDDDDYDRPKKPPTSPGDTGITERS